MVLTFRAGAIKPNHTQKAGVTISVCKTHTHTNSNQNCPNFQFSTSSWMLKLSNTKDGILQRDHEQAFSFIEVSSQVNLSVIIHLLYVYIHVYVFLYIHKKTYIPFFTVWIKFRANVSCLKTELPKIFPNVTVMIEQICHIYWLMSSKSGNPEHFTQVIQRHLYWMYVNIWFWRHQYINQTFFLSHYCQNALFPVSCFKNLSSKVESQS